MGECNSKVLYTVYPAIYGDFAIPSIELKKISFNMLMR